MLDPEVHNTKILTLELKTRIVYWIPLIMIAWSLYPLDILLNPPFWISIIYAVFDFSYLLRANIFKFLDYSVSTIDIW